MYLMRIGPAGAERPVVRIDDHRYVDVSDATNDFDEAFFGGANGGIDRLRSVVAARTAAGAGEPVRRGADRCTRSPGRTRSSASA